ncbi:uncharacterized protein K489DRAFT_45070 [Dissoconium aciculare CBS 342.82]|uniref:Uncharacterized protein n=1 Tax=Dissoconium aciculare CBS 342.82 TaxID=1314786 RepID=A0A6J3LZH4_9PEZI|nr:uncharacterized protein K489DRAFT_45070 [Dissoconium aciculare CBS 342.82]KAF1820037.1 hypothetical protein K489DRAFT_45070 [Dissoconium aciculare CBS 342.82]
MDTAAHRLFLRNQLRPLGRLLAAVFHLPTATADEERGLAPKEGMDLPCRGCALCCEITTCLNIIHLSIFLSSLSVICYSHDQFCAIPSIVADRRQSHQKARTKIIAVESEPSRDIVLLKAVYATPLGVVHTLTTAKDVKHKRSAFVNEA